MYGINKYQHLFNILASFEKSAASGDHCCLPQRSRAIRILWGTAVQYPTKTEFKVVNPEKKPIQPNIKKTNFPGKDL